MDYAMTPSWLVGARVSVQRLEAETAKSPIMQQADQVTGVLFLAWRF
jgi:MipA family protein